MAYAPTTRVRRLAREEEALQLVATTVVSPVRSRTGSAVGPTQVVALIAAAMGAAIGFLVAGLTPVTYVSEARVAVAPNGLQSAGAVAGLPTTTAKLAARYAQAVDDEHLAHVRAAAISQSNVVRIRASSTVEGEARQAAQRAADNLMRAVNDGGGKYATASLDSYASAASAFARAETEQRDRKTEYEQVKARGGSRAELAAAGNRLSAATQDLFVAQTRKSALAATFGTATSSLESFQLISIQRATSAGSDRTSRMLRLTAWGGASGTCVSLLAIGLMTRVSRRSHAGPISPDRRLRKAPDL